MARWTRTVRPGSEIVFARGVFRGRRDEAACAENAFAAYSLLRAAAGDGTGTERKAATERLYVRVHQHKKRYLFRKRETRAIAERARLLGARFDIF
jgi:hypothetical protein